MDASWLDRAKYLINLDNELSSQVLVSTAAGDLVNMTRSVEFVPATGNKALSLDLSGLKGGRSGVLIGEGRMNGIIGMAEFLKRLGEASITYELASFDGGTAGNAIAPRAHAVIVVDSGDAAKVEDEEATWLSEMKEKYAGIEDGMNLAVSDAGEVPQVVSAEIRDALVRLATGVKNGVHTMSPDMEGLVESSSNFGMLKLDEEGLNAIATTRSSVDEREKELLGSHKALAQEIGCEVEVTGRPTHSLTAPRQAIAQRFPSRGRCLRR